MPGNHPQERIQHSQRSESLESRIRHTRSLLTFIQRTESIQRTDRPSSRPYKGSDSKGHTQLTSLVTSPTWGSMQHGLCDCQLRTELEFE